MNDLISLARTANKKTFKKAVKSKKKDLKTKDSEGRTLLHVSSEEGNLDVTSYLIKKNLNVNANDREGWTPLHSASSNGKIRVCELLLERGADPKVMNVDKVSPLHYYVKRDYKKEESEYALKVLSLFYSKGADLNVQNKNGETPLYGACLKGSDEIIVSLLQNGANPNTPNSLGDTPLNCCVRLKRYTILQILVKFGATPNNQTQTLLENYNDSKLNALISTPNSQAQKIPTPQVASENLSEFLSNNAVSPRSLISPRLNSSASSSFSISSSITGTLTNSANIFHTTRSASVALPSLTSAFKINLGQEEIFQAVKSGNYKEYKKLFKSKMASCQDDDGKSLLHIAVENNHKEIVSSLLECEEVDINARDNEGNTPLHIACKAGNTSLISTLLERGGEPSSTNTLKSTPVHYFVTHSYDEKGIEGKILLSFLEKGSGFNYIDYNGYSPIHIAVQSGSEFCVWFLVKFGANPNLFTQSGDTAIHLAIQKQRPRVVAILMQYGGNPHLSGGPHGTAREYAITLGQSHLLELLDRSVTHDFSSFDKYLRPDENLRASVITAVKEKNVSELRKLLKQVEFANAQDDDGKSLLHLSLEEECDEITSFLIEKKCNLNLEDKNGWTPLHVAAANAQIHWVQALLSNGANPNTINTDGSSPLHYFVRKGVPGNPVQEETILELFTKQKVDLNSRNSQGETPLHSVVTKGNEVTTKLLLKSGAHPNSRNTQGDTALHIATIMNRKNVIRYLLKAGADPNLKGTKGTCIEIAKSQNMSDILELFNNVDGIGNPITLEITIEGRDRELKFTAHENEKLKTIFDRLPKQILSGLSKNDVIFTNERNEIMNFNLPKKVLVQVTDGPNDFSSSPPLINIKYPLVIWFNDYWKSFDEIRKKRIAGKIIENQKLNFGQTLDIYMTRTLRFPPSAFQFQDFPVPPQLGDILMINSSKCKGPDVSEQITKNGGTVLPMLQSEALNIRFEGKYDLPTAVRISLDDKNLVTNNQWNKSLSQSPQDYIVCPYQTWLYGVSDPDKGFVREIVAPKLREPGVVPNTLQIQAIPIGHINFRASLSLPGLRTDREYLHLNIAGTPKSNGCSCGDIIWIESPELGHTIASIADYYPTQEPFCLKAYDKTILCKVNSKYLSREYSIKIPLSFNISQLKRELNQQLPPIPKYELHFKGSSCNDETKVITLNNVPVNVSTTNPTNSVLSGFLEFELVIPSAKECEDWKCDISPISPHTSRTPKIRSDPFHNLFWDMKRSIRMFVHIVNTEMLLEWAHMKLSRPPIYPSKYILDKLPYLPEYSEEQQQELTAEEIHRLNQANKKEKDVDLYTFVL